MTVQNRSFTQPRPLMEITGDLAIHKDVRANLRRAPLLAFLLLACR